MQNILITGGAGFIGTNLIKSLQGNYTLYSIADYSTGKKENEKHKVIVFIFQKI